MNITDVRVYLRNGKQNIKAFASVTLDDVFAVKDLCILESAKGLFVAMPARRDAQGKYHDVAHPITREFRDRIQGQVLEAYRKAAHAS